jgi:hypothetical protein
MDAHQPAVGAGLVDRLRRWILIVLTIGLVGTITELVLLEHYEKPMQLVPVALIAIGIATLVWHVMKEDPASRRAVIVVMALFVLSGFVGVLVHFLGSAEFQLELEPDMGMWELVEKVMRAKAPPVLAPGMMLQFGLLGLAYVYSDSRYRRSNVT